MPGQLCTTGGGIRRSNGGGGVLVPIGGNGSCGCKALELFNCDNGQDSGFAVSGGSFVAGNVVQFGSSGPCYRLNNSSGGIVLPATTLRLMNACSNFSCGTCVWGSINLHAVATTYSGITLCANFLAATTGISSAAVNFSAKFPIGWWDPRLPSPGSVGCQYAGVVAVLPGSQTLGGVTYTGEWLVVSNVGIAFSQFFAAVELWFVRTGGTTAQYGDAFSAGSSTVATSYSLSNQCTTCDPSAGVGGTECDGTGGTVVATLS